MSTAPQTFIESEERCYPDGGFRRKGRAVVRANPHNPVVLPYGEVRAVRAGIADTFSSIPAFIVVKGRRVRGFLSYPADAAEGVLCFTPEADPEHCPVCSEEDGCKKVRHQVVVGNVGQVYDGWSRAAAGRVYREYIDRSRAYIGRAAGESVTWFENGEIVKNNQGGR